MNRPTANRPAARLALLACCTLALIGGGVVLAKDKPKKGDPDVTVTMKRAQFVPEDVTIKVGQTVRWDNQDDRDYVIMADDQSFKSDNLRPKETFDHKFTEAGKFGYKNVIRMREGGTVTVTAE